MAFFHYADVVAELFPFLTALEQKALRNVDRSTVRAFSHAVQLGFVSSDIATCSNSDAQPKDTNISWFPATRIPDHHGFALRIAAHPSNIHKGICRAVQEGGEQSVVHLFSVNTSQPTSIDRLLRDAEPALDYRAIDSLEVLELNGLPQRELTANGQAFFVCKSSIRRFSLINLPKIEAIPGSSFRLCSAFEVFELSCLPELKSIEMGCLVGCTALQQVVLIDLPKLESIGDHFASSSGLTTLEIAGLSGLRIIGKWVFDYCRSLRRLVLAKLPKLETIGEVFAEGCSSLELVRFAELPHLKTIGERFLEDCPSLNSLHLVNLPQLQSMPDGFNRANFPMLCDFVQENVPNIPAF